MAHDLSHPYPHATGEGKPFLCRIGIHRKQFIGLSLLGDSFYECARCHRRWLYLLVGAIFYEDMPPQGWEHK